jgi:Cdc6-like AAA superfamily ATPase
MTPNDDTDTNVLVPKAERAELARNAMTLFSPSGPVTTEELFAGRVGQMRDLIAVHGQAGQHAVVYGERGVGKTSLAATMVDIMRSQLIAVRANCDSSDDFSSIWHKVLTEIEISRETQAPGFTGEGRKTVATAASLLPAKDVSPNDVRRALTVTASASPIVIFLDEFDRLKQSSSAGLFADTIKTLSDQLVPATVVMVGVADNVEGLIAEHRSVERALVQIHMPRMSLEELSEIVNRVRHIEMKVDRDARKQITHLSQGLPHYTHGLSQAAAVAAIERGSRQIGSPDVSTAIRTMIERRAQESVVSAYHRATFSTRETLYRQVLLACALARGDDLGYFASGDVRAPLSMIMGRAYDIPAFSQHLNELSDPTGARGPVLEKAGTSRKFRFRFVNPLLQPYVVLRGITDGTITMEDARKLEVAARPSGSAT